MNMLMKSFLLPLLLPSAAVAKTILGVDLGSLYMKVALVQRNSPLEIVTNMHSKRKTEQMILFDAGTRFYGADANSLIARKPQKTPQAMSVFLGRDADHPTAQVLAERHYPITPSYNETRSGVCLTIEGNSFTPEELVAMVLNHARDITAAYGVQGDIKDCVLTVPSFYTQHERRALLDAAALASLNVLALIDETTAAGLHYGIDRIEEEPQNVLFYNMGASALQVSVMQFYSYERKDSKYSKAKKVGAFQVLGKAWDASLGGLAFDSRIVSYMADEFNEIWNKKRNDGETKDVRKYARPMSKLRIQANKIKHVLSANTDMPIFIDSLYDDTSYQSHMTRSKFEEICEDLLKRSAEPITQALKAANITLDDINGVELIGGGMRVPKVQESIKATLGEKLDLGMHINSDESMALGAAFHGANISTAFRVRHVGMTDVNPFPVAVHLADLAAGEEAPAEAEEEESSDADAEEEEAWSKRATIFKFNGKTGVKKTIAFTHDSEVACDVEYVADSEFLPDGTSASIEKYNITGIEKFAKEMSEKGLSKPKVSLQFELSTSGLVKLVKAEAAVEEIYTVTEDVEVDDDEAEEEAEKTEEASEAEEKKEESAEKTEEEAEKKEEDTTEEKKEESTEEKTEETTEEKKDDSADSAEEKKEEKKEKKKKTIQVEKEKKRVHKRTLSVSSYHTGSVQPYNEEIMVESKAKLAELARLDKERMMLEEIRNKYESYMYYIKNQLIDHEEAIGKISTEEQREALLKSAAEAEDWMYDEGYDADLATYSEKYEELSAPAEKVFFRMKEVPAREEAVKTLSAKLDKVEALMKKWETSMEHITEEERGEVLTEVGVVRKWIEEKVAEQEAADPTEDAVFTSAEVPKQTAELQKIVSKLSKKPKPTPKKKKEEKKNETDTEESEKKNETETDETKEESEADTKDDEAEKTEAKDDEAKAEGEEKKEEESTDSTEEEKEGDEL